MSNYTFNDGTEQPLLNLNGVLPIFYVRQSNQRYNLPIDIYLPPQYPLQPPLVYVRPKENMKINSNCEYVDACGCITSEYLRHWDYPASNLIDFVADLQFIFGQKTPLIGRAASSAASSEPPGTHGIGGGTGFARHGAPMTGTGYASGGSTPSPGPTFSATNPLAAGAIGAIGSAAAAASHQTGPARPSHNASTGTSTTTTWNSNVFSHLLQNNNNTTTNSTHAAGNAATSGGGMHASYPGNTATASNPLHALPSQQSPLAAAGTPWAQHSHAVHIHQQQPQLPPQMPPAMPHHAANTTYYAQQQQQQQQQKKQQDDQKRNARKQQRDASYRLALTTALAVRLGSALDAAACVERDRQLEIKRELETRSATLVADLASLQKERERLDSAALELNNTNKALEKWLNENEPRAAAAKAAASGDDRNSDAAQQAIVAADPLSHEALIAQAADLALEDAMMALDKALESGDIVLDAYLRQIRIASRRQFVARMVSKKVAAKQFVQESGSGTPREERSEGTSRISQQQQQPMAMERMHPSGSGAEMSGVGSGQIVGPPAQLPIGDRYHDTGGILLNPLAQAARNMRIS
jgi:ESCRT-I complex subunit TSG101